MKRLLMLAVLCSFVLSAAAASAADIKASGAWAVEAVWASNWGFDKSGSMKANTAGMDSYGVYQRARTIFDFVANENLKGVLYTQYGTGTWGQSSFQIGDGDGTTGVFAVRRAYLDFNWPDTAVNVKAGYFAMSLPAAFGGGSYVLDEEAAGVVVSGAMTDNVSYLLGYARAFSTAKASQSAKKYSDAFVAALPMDFDGFKLQPFGVYQLIGSGMTAAAVQGDSVLRGLAAINASSNGSGEDFDNAWWLGAAFSMDLFDPIVLKADFNYGQVNSKKSQNKRKGWLFDIALEYTGMESMTPELFFVYSTGEDGNGSKGNGSERMPVLAAQSWAIGSFYFGGDTLLNGSINNRKDTLGYWALGLSLKDIQSFADGLTHTAHFIYAKGTNNKDTFTASGGATSSNNYGVKYGATLTEKDTLYEIDFNTAYKLYDELTMTLDLGYVNLNTKKERWDGTDGQKGGDAWKVSTGVVYQF